MSPSASRPDGEFPPTTFQIAPSRTRACAERESALVARNLLRGTGARLRQAEGAPFRVTTHRPTLARVDYFATELNHASECLGEVGDREVGQREPVTRTDPAFVDSQGHASLLRLPTLSILGRSGLDRNSQDPCPETSCTLRLVSGKLDQLQHQPTVALRAVPGSALAPRGPGHELRHANDVASAKLLGMRRFFKADLPVLLVASAAAVGTLLSGCGGQIQTPAPVADVAAGQRAYEATCASCHGPAGLGAAQGPPFVDRIYEPSHHADVAFTIAVRQGVPAHHWGFGDMPPVPGVSAAQLADIVAYIRTLQVAAGIT